VAAQRARARVQLFEDAMTVESTRGESTVSPPLSSALYFSHVTMHRARRCHTCGTLLTRGTPARLASLHRRRKRRILCVPCAEETAARAAPREREPSIPHAEPDRSGTFRAAPRAAGDDPAVPPVPPACSVAAAVVSMSMPEMPARGSTAVWIAVGILGIGALLGSRTGRRLLRTTGVALKATASGASARVRGDENAAPAAMREAFEELGPTYVKLGQLVASSQGLFPEPYCREFRKCLDRVRPFPYEDVHRIVRAELGRDPEEVFASIDPEPLASASIAQVHAAKLHDGQDVVIKVQRPKIGEIVEADLRVLRLGARALAMFPRADLANPVGVVEDFQETIRAELDFRREADHMREFNRIMGDRGQARVAAPRVVGELSTERVLVMERFFGHRVDDVEKLRASKVDAEEQLLRGMRAWFQCMILHGFFHGDVHAGNLMALDDGRVGFLDFGIIGRFSRERREQVTDYLVAFATGDFPKLANVMVAMGSVERDRIDIEALAKDLAASYEPLLSSAASPAKYADIIPEIMRTGVKHGMRMPRDFVLVVKQMVYFDRYAKLLAPNLNVFRDPRIVAGLMEDMAEAQAAAATPATRPAGEALDAAARGVALTCR
jgi:predicted unusual protein kinase regulating ubiquinone biosynthesis (AarF/ABC1/UbiB family)